MKSSFESLIRNSRRNNAGRSFEMGDDKTVLALAPELSSSVTSWASDISNSETIQKLDAVNRVSIQQQAELIFERLKKELHISGYSDDYIMSLKAKLDSCKTEEEVQEVVEAMRNEMQERVSGRINSRIEKATKRSAIAENHLTSPEHKERTYKEIMAFGSLLKKMLTDLKMGVRTDYSTVFTQTKQIESLMRTKIAMLQNFSGSAKDGFNISDAKVQEFTSTANSIYKYATALDLQRSVKSKYNSSNCAQMIIKSGQRNVYVSVDEDERVSGCLSTNMGGGFDVAVGDKNKTSSVKSGRVNESTLKNQYQKEVFSIEKRIMKLLGSKFFSDTRYSFTYDPVDGYTISSNGTELSDGPEEIRVKLFKNGSLDQVYIKDYGKKTSVEVEGSSPAEVRRDMKAAKMALQRASEAGKTAPMEMA